MNDRLTILQGDCVERLRELPAASVHCCVTSPPYWGLRDYGVSGQLGLEKTPEEYVAKMVAVFDEVRRVLRDDGTCWVNIGDSYCSVGGLHDGRDDNQPNVGAKRAWRNGCGRADGIVDERGQRNRNGNCVPGLKPKDLIGIPWLVAFALRAKGWCLRSEITWLKRAPMPESVTDRPTSATEKIFLLTKQPRYFYDAAAVRQPASEAFAKDRRWETGSTDKNEKFGYAEALAQNPKKLHRMFDKQRGHSRRHAGFNDRWDQMTKQEQMALGSNLRNYWLLSPEPYSESHFATFPTEVPRRCILAGCPVSGTVLDPFAGSGTTGQVALELGRKAILIELNPKYVELIRKRCDVTPGLALA